MGVTHILFKVGQGSNYYEDRAGEAVRRIREADLVPFAWMWLTLGDPENEALVVKRAFDEGYEGLVFDMEEHQNPNLSSAGRYEEATQLGSHLEEMGVDPEKLYLCSFPNIYSHRGGPPYNQPGLLPYDQMAAFCRGGTMPMSYGTFLRPPETVIDDWTYGHHERWCREREDSLPVYPVLGPYFDEAGQDVMTPEEFDSWLERLDRHDPTFFSVYAARSVDPALAPLVRDFDLGVEERPGRAQRRLFARLSRVLRAFILGARVEEETHGEYVVVESPALGFLRLRAAPTTSSDELLRIPHRTVLHSLEGDATAGKVNQPGEWLRVRTPSRHEGYVAGWYLRWPDESDERQPVEDASLPMGQSAWLYGMHITSVDEDPIYRDEIRGLFHETGKRGWVLFTEAIGRRPDALQPNQERRRRFWNWAREAGYGVIVRLNHGYHAAGTLPESAHYEAFAETCARYAELYLNHSEEGPGRHKWVIIIGNEQNNPREWPREGHPPEPITSQRYANAFNLAYQAIKEALPDASTIVVPGAVDPYSYSDALGLPPLHYFQTMLEEIDRLDGFVLHTYTHGHNVGFIKHTKKFDHDPLRDHYYDFQCYRLFMERIPVKWHRLPVYVTETNPLFKTEEGDWGWKDENIGWIQAAYGEIDEWNKTPYAQQIRALLLYRWAGDEWTMRGKGELLRGFREALIQDYRWRA
jgi:hypothetical protein